MKRSKIESAFGQQIPFPNLLAEFETWAGQLEPGSLGFLEFLPTTLNDRWIENGSKLANRFALWLCLGDGSMVGFWRPGHFADDDVLPVILLGSEGNVEILGESLEDFLFKWANGGHTFEHAHDLCPTEEDLDTEFMHAKMLDWLQTNNIVLPAVTHPITTEDLQRFFDEWQAKN